MRGKVGLELHWCSFQYQPVCYLMVALRRRHVYRAYTKVIRYA